MKEQALCDGPHARGAFTSGVIPPIRPMASSDTGREIKVHFNSFSALLGGMRAGLPKGSSPAAIRGSTRVTRGPRKSSLSFSAAVWCAALHHKAAVGPEHFGTAEHRIRKTAHEVRGGVAASLTFGWSSLAAIFRSAPRQVEEQAVSATARTRPISRTL